ncbi:MAG: lipid-A-disaccharide synthase, partial [Rhodospirillaceae bacterium]|nr:lipid-A-disaccharide synthase [Rhodospirillaceae bacterium]
MPAQHFVLVAGEASGDVLGARLISALRQRHSGELKFSGVGGAQMAAEGLDSLFPIADLSVMGLAEILPRVPLLLRRLRETTLHVKAAQPSALITIDAPGFSFRLAKRLAGQGIPLIHYVAPQVWAWRPDRARHLAGRIDHLLALLPFEPEFFHGYDLPCDFVGHPVIEGVAEAPGDGPGFRHGLAIADGAPVLALLPGSRVGEVNRLMPVFASVAALLHAQRPGLHVVIPTVEQVAGVVAEAVSGWPMPTHLVEGTARRADAFAAADVALAASGTVSLELALRGIPTVVAYRTNPLTAVLVRRMLTIPHVALPNILAKKAVLPEFLQQDCRAEPIAAALTQLLDDPEQRLRQQKALAHVAGMLGQGGTLPSLRAADAVLQITADNS